MQFPKPIGDRETLALVMHLMSSVRLHEEDAVILQIGTHAPDAEVPLLATAGTGSSFLGKPKG